jgi:hypothetical protein
MQPKFAMLAALSLLCATTLACKPSPHTQARSAEAAAHIDVLCLGDRINNPPEPFHYSFKYSDEADSFDNEADITPQEMNITTRDKSGTHSYHGVRSDEASWNAAVLNLSGLRLTAMSARLDALNGTTAISRQGTESVNGYTTAKYAIDTTQASSADRQQFETLFGKGSYEKGTLWAPSDGCTVKLVLDDAIWRSGGAIDHGRYEIARIKP